MLGINSQGNSRFRRSPESVFYLKRTQTRISGVHPLSSPMVFWFPHSGFFLWLKTPGFVFYMDLWTECIKCDCVITGTPKWATKRWPGSDTRWHGLLGHRAAVREVWGSHHILLTLFRVRQAFLARGQGYDTNWSKHKVKDMTKKIFMTKKVPYFFYANIWVEIESEVKK